MVGLRSPPRTILPRANVFVLRRTAFRISGGLPTTFDENVPLPKELEIDRPEISIADAYLERIFPAEALVAVATRERLDRQVDPLVPLQIVVSVEALRALIAFERPVNRLLTRLRPVHVLHVSSVAGVENRSSVVAYGHVLAWRVHARHHRDVHAMGRVLRSCELLNRLVDGGDAGVGCRH